MSLEDIEQAFREGKWGQVGGKVAYGGLKWARIAQSAIALREAFLANDTDRTPELLREIQTLEHNNGRS